MNEQIILKWRYPVQPTQLGIGGISIYRAKEPFEVSELSSKTLIVYKEFDPDFVTYTDELDLEYDVTYYYRIVVHGDSLPEIIASTGLYSIVLRSPSYPEPELQ